MPARILAAPAALVAVASFSARGQDWPNRPVRMIVPFAAGGSTDVAARLVGEYLSRAFGQQVYVENRTGANGVIGIEAAAKSDAGRLHHPGRAGRDRQQPACLQGELRRAEGPAPVVQLSRQPIVLAAHPSLGVEDPARA